jgi:oxalate decarboxylase/phosphoglucose isomerase-like protein (cupin superfamily)
MKARVVPVPTETQNTEQPTKFGIWCTDRMHASTWHVRPGQRIVTNMHPLADEIITILAGSADLIVFDEQPPNPDICYEPEPGRGVTPPPPGDHGPHRRLPIISGEVGLIGAGTFWGLLNTGEDDVVAVSCVGPDVSKTSWTVRQAEA